MYKLRLLVFAKYISQLNVFGRAHLLCLLMSLLGMYFSFLSSANTSLNGHQVLHSLLLDACIHFHTHGRHQLVNKLLEYLRFGEMNYLFTLRYNAVLPSTYNNSLLAGDI